MAVVFESPIQSAVLAYMLTHAPVEPKAKTFSFSFDDEPERTYYCASARLLEEDGINLVLNTGLYGDTVFFTFTKGDPEKVAVLLGHMEAFNSRTPMSIGDTFRPEGATDLTDNGWAAILVFRASVSQFTPDFADHEILASGVCRRFALVTFLDEEEYTLKKAKGLDALIDRFIERQKDLVTFRAPHLDRRT